MDSNERELNQIRATYLNDEQLDDLWRTVKLGPNGVNQVVIQRWVLRQMVLELMDRRSCGIFNPTVDPEKQKAQELFSRFFSFR